MAILSFFLGIVITYTQLKEAWVSLFVILFMTQKKALPLFALLGAGFAFFHEAYNAPKGLPDSHLLRLVSIDGVVSSVPKVAKNKVQFQFDLFSLNGKKVKANLWLNCYQACPEFKVGERWRMKASLKKAKRYHLPNESDFSFWMKSRHIHRTGVVHTQGAALILKRNPGYQFQVFRSDLAEKIEHRMGGHPSLGMVQGLTLGMTHHLDKSQWDLFRRTGITHLMVISGAHLGMVAGAMFFIMRFIWSRSAKLCTFLPAQRAAILCAFLLAIFYAFLTGLGAPVIRSLIGFGVMGLRYFLSVRFTTWQAWRYGLLLVLLVEPHAVLTPGFYLSFIAVAVLVLVSARFAIQGIRGMFILQLGCLIGLMPSTLYAFSYASLNGFLANMIAIPWVSMVMIPSSLIGVLLISFHEHEVYLWPAAQAGTLLKLFLDRVDTLSFINLHSTLPSLYGLISVCLGLFFLLFFPLRRMYGIYVCLILLPFFPKKESVKTGSANITVFDVGQGLAVLIKTASHVLLYDTGGRFYQGGDWAQSRIIPYLYHLKIKSIDAIVVSHQDIDHRGGLASLEQQFKVSKLWVNSPEFYQRGEGCHVKEKWQWDGVIFSFLPLPLAGEKRNNTSCILKVQASEEQLLLTGDIEARAEQYLVENEGDSLNATHLLVPHHGSRTSSSIPFIRAVSPRIGILSTGLNNRYHFPHRKTLDSFGRLGIVLQDTAELGPIQFELHSGR